MKRATKIWLIAAASLVLAGCILFAGVMTTLKWDTAKLSTAQYETNTHKIDEPFRAISLTTDTADIAFTLSDDGKCRVVCYEETAAKHTVTVENEVLTVNVDDQRDWYDYTGFHFDAPKVTVYLPDTDYAALTIREHTGSVDLPQAFSFDRVDISTSTGGVTFCASARETVRIGTSTGDIRVEGAAAGTLDLTVTTGIVTVSGVDCAGDISVDVSTGRANLTDVTCRNLTSTGSTGNLTLTQVRAAGTFSIERSTGSVYFDGADAAEISVRTSTGNVTGSLLTGKAFAAHSDTGRVDAPQSGTGGRCEIDSNTGDIQISIP